MTRLSLLITAAAVAGSNAFAPSFVGSSGRSTELHASKIATVKKQIDGLTKDNFSSTLTEIEPFLTKEAGVSIYKKSMRRISTKATAFGVELPSDFAKDAKATAKR